MVVISDSNMASPITGTYQYPQKVPRMISIMTPDDYDAAHACWMACTGMGLNTIDDSREGIIRYLKRNPNTCFVSEHDGTITGAILAGHDGRRGYIYHAAVNPHTGTKASAPHSSTPHCTRSPTKASSKSPSSSSHATMQATLSGSASASLHAAI